MKAVFALVPVITTAISLQKVSQIEERPQGVGYPENHEWNAELIKEDSDCNEDGDILLTDAAQSLQECTDLCARTEGCEFFTFDVVDLGSCW